MKKLLAGVLAAVTVLSVSAPAFASTTKRNVTKASEIEYEVSAKKPSIILKVSLPAEMRVALNPAGNTFRLSEKNTIATSDNGIVSVAYPIINNDVNYGIIVSAAALTTTSSEDWDVTTKTLSANKKEANMALVASTTEEGIAVYSNTSKNATSATDQGVLVLDSTVEKTSVQKLAYLPAHVDGEGQSVVYLGFTGALADNVVWDFDDNIYVDLILKLNPAPKTL